MQGKGSDLSELPELMIHIYIRLRQFQSAHNHLTVIIEMFSHIFRFGIINKPMDVKSKTVRSSAW